MTVNQHGGLSNATGSISAVYDFENEIKNEVEEATKSDSYEAAAAAYQKLQSLLNSIVNGEGVDLNGNKVDNETLRKIAAVLINCVDSVFKQSSIYGYWVSDDDNFQPPPVSKDDGSRASVYDFMTNPGAHYSDGADNYYPSNADVYVDWDPNAIDAFDNYNYLSF